MIIVLTVLLFDFVFFIFIIFLVVFILNVGLALLEKDLVPVKIFFQIIIMVNRLLWFNFNGIVKELKVLSTKVNLEHNYLR